MDASNTYGEQAALRHRDAEQVTQMSEEAERCAQEAIDPDTREYWVSMAAAYRSAAESLERAASRAEMRASIVTTPTGLALAERLLAP
jgi:alpha-ketoglutarate-dependent taurine dioxygenase